MADAPTTPPPRPESVTVRRRILGLCALIALLALIAASDELHERLLAAFAVGERLIAARPGLGVSAFVILAALSAMLAFFSSAVLVPVAIRTWGEPTSMLLLWSGWTAGGMIAYSVGRYLGRPVVRALSSGALLDRVEQRISARAPFGLVLLFQTALPSEIPGYVLGLLRYRFLKYLLALGLAELPFAVGTIYLGTSFIERQIPMLVAIGAGGALLSGFAFYLLQKRLSL